jgi:hypothetical protein
LEFKMTSITIELPDDVAQSAKQAGLLSSQTLANVVRELVRQRAAHQLLQTVSVFDAQPVTAGELTLDEIGLAIDAARRH